MRTQTELHNSKQFLKETAEEHLRNTMAL
jgi:hypothetical protein